MLAKASALLFAAGSCVLAVSSSAVVIDFSRNGGADFDNNTATVTAPIDPADPTRTISVVGSRADTGLPAELAFRDLGGNGFTYGVRNNPLSTTDASISGFDRLSFTFNFAGGLDGVDFIDLVNQQKVFIQKTSGLTSDIRTFVQNTFFTDSAGTFALDDGDDDVNGLITLDEDFFTFGIGDTFTLSADANTSTNFGLQRLSVLIPTPGAAPVLLVSGLLCLTRRRRSDTASV